MADEKPVCPLCNGREWTTEDNLKSKPCRCIQGRMIKSFLGGEIASANHVRSPLFQPDGDDRTEENLFLKGTWGTVCSHLRWVLGCKYNLNSAYTYRIVTDRKIVNVTLGNYSYGQRSKKSRDDQETYNSIDDLMESPDLIIVRLGWMEYKNQAAAGYLKQALGVRESNGKPTWLVEEPGRYFGPGCTTWDEDVQEYVVEHYDIVDLHPTKSDAEPAPKPQPVVSQVPTGSSSDSVGFGVDESPDHGEDDVMVSVESIFRSPQKRKDKWRPGKKSKSFSRDDDDGGPLGGIDL